MNYSTPISVLELKKLIHQLEQAEQCISELIESGETSDPRLLEYQEKREETLNRILKRILP